MGKGQAVQSMMKCFLASPISLLSDILLCFGGKECLFLYPNVTIQQNILLVLKNSHVLLVWGKASAERGELHAGCMLLVSSYGLQSK